MNCPTPRYVWPNNHIQAVPCGKCLACLVNKRNDWAFRIDQEYRRSKSAAFITLTYHPRFYPADGVSKVHFQQFMKRLRKHVNGSRLRYFAVGEYGSKHGRAHYHLILFNADIARPYLEKAWSVNGVPIGIVDVRPVNVGRIRYITKYVIQRDSYVPKGMNKPFSLMSRAYGIGLWYLDDAMVAWHRQGERNYTMQYGVKGRLPRYYKNFIWPHEEVRKKVMEKSAKQAEEKHKKNVEYLRGRGYDPETILAEMRKAVFDRVKEKIAFSQIF